MAILAAIIALTGSKRPQQVAFCATVSSKQNLYVIDVDGTGPKQVTKSPSEDYYPAWSPDGSTILFTRIPGHKTGEVRSDGHLWTVRPDGTLLTRLTSGPVFDGDPRWSRNGKRVFFMRQGSKPGFYGLNIRTKKIARISLDAWTAVPSPNGKLIAYVHSETGREGDYRADIWLTTSIGRRGKRLTRFRSGVDQPQWSPDGRNLAFKVEKPPGPNSGDELCILSISSRKIRTLVNGHNNAIEDPRWSPDGARLCFLESTGQDPMTNASFRQLYVISDDGKGRRRLTNHWGDDFSPQWTRDGKFIVVQGERGMRHVEGGVIGESSIQLVVVDAFGKGERILPTGLSCYSPALSP